MSRQRLPLRAHGQSPRVRCCGFCISAILLLTGCGTNGDFGRVRQTLVTDNIHAWVGTEAARSYGAPVSRFRLTDEERLLRDLAYPLIEPPYERQRWLSIVGEYGIARVFHRDWWHRDRTAYYTHLKFEWHRSASGQYGKLIEDIRNDSVRIDPFFDAGARVADLDRKRQKSLAYISELTRAERDNTVARIGENSLIVSWVARSLSERAQSYRYALERMVITIPSSQAVEAEQQLTLLQQKIARHRLPFPPPPPAIVRAKVSKRVSKKL